MARRPGGDGHSDLEAGEGAWTRAGLGAQGQSQVAGWVSAEGKVGNSVRHQLWGGSDAVGAVPRWDSRGARVRGGRNLVFGVGGLSGPSRRPGAVGLGNKTLTGHMWRPPPKMDPELLASRGVAGLGELGAPRRGGLGQLSRSCLFVPVSHSPRNFQVAGGFRCPSAWGALKRR